MDARKIDRAVVASASAITYRNAQSGNEEVDDEVKAHRDRLIPFARHQPDVRRLGRRSEDLPRRLRHAGVRLYPKWQNITLSDTRCLDLVHAATERGMIISITVRVEDPRERSWLVEIPDLALDEVAGLVKSCPRSAVPLILNGLGFRNTPLGGRQAACLPTIASRSPG